MLSQYRHSTSVKVYSKHVSYWLISENYYPQVFSWPQNHQGNVHFSWPVSETAKKITYYFAI